MAPQESMLRPRLANGHGRPFVTGFPPQAEAFQLYVRQHGAGSRLGPGNVVFLVLQRGYEPSFLPAINALVWRRQTFVWSSERLNQTRRQSLNRPTIASSCRQSVADILFGVAVSFPRERYGEMVVGPV
jgi:hypothetical protein